LKPPGVFGGWKNVRTSSGKIKAGGCAGGLGDSGVFTVREGGMPMTKKQPGANIGNTKGGRRS